MQVERCSTLRTRGEIALELCMAVITTMLRGVDVGAHNRIKMDALRALYESLGLRDPQTYVQSGNVVFSTDKRDLVALAKRIEDAIERGFGFRPPVILRTSCELRDVIARNPFTKRIEDAIERGFGFRPPVIL